MQKNTPLVKYPYKTAKELKKELPDYWVLLINAEYDKDHDLIGGNLVAKGKDHSKVCEKGGKISVKNVVVSTWFTGKIEVPENVILCL